MKKLKLILKISLGVLPVLVLILMFLPLKDDGEVSENPAFFEPAPSTNYYSSRGSDNLSIAKNSGEIVTVKNFIENSVTYDEINYSLTGGLDSTQDNFSVNFYQPDEFFAITLDSEPLDSSRLAAEAFFLEQTGLTKENACGLNITVMVPYTVNSFFAGEDLGLSFCPGSLEL